jgi:hypothetical protein
VVLKDKPDTGVAEASLCGELVDDQEHMFISGTSDAQGNFSLRRGKSDLYLWATTADKKLAGIVKVAAGDANATVPVGPTASAHGRLVDEAGTPLPGRQIDYGYRIDHHPFGTYGYRFGGSVKTNDNGEFIVEGLVPDFEYTLNVVLELGDEGRPRSWQPAGKAKAERVERVELGDLTLKTPRPRPK